MHVVEGISDRVVALVAWQAASGLGNVLLGWPLVAALAHTAGAAGLVVVVTILLMRSAPARSIRSSASVAARPTLAS